MEPVVVDRTRCGRLEVYFAGEWTIAQTVDQANLAAARADLLQALAARARV